VAGNSGGLTGISPFSVDRGVRQAKRILRNGTKQETTNGRYFLGGITMITAVTIYPLIV
jgi:hypothetical protein